MTPAQFDFTGAVVLVTGGTKGIGRVICEKFLGAGAEVVTCGRNEPESLPTAGDRAARFVACDVREPDQVDALISQVEEWFGGLDVVVNNAGGSPEVLAADASPRFSESIIRLNLMAPLHIAQRANRTMQTQDRGGVIVNIASVSAIRPSPGASAYGAAKAGLLSLTQTLAMEWAPKVRVVSVTCGLIATEQTNEYYGDATQMAAVAATVPLGRMGTPNDVADACMFLASPSASFVSGGGLLLHGGGEAPNYLSAGSVASETSGASGAHREVD
ncbi:MAG TPA: SDR family oxidoreductase [Microthrixaceae bacterium]|nr:SDR family oxidoreductase [Microthrixaceae bacterium]